MDWGFESQWKLFSFSVSRRMDPFTFEKCSSCTLNVYFVFCCCNTNIFIFYLYTFMSGFLLPPTLHRRSVLCTEWIPYQEQMWLNSSKWTSWVRSSKLIFCFFLNGCSFSSIWLKTFEIGHCILKLWQFNWYRH